MKIGVCGLGGFGQRFVPLFLAHPAVEEVAVADPREDAVKHLFEKNAQALPQLERKPITRAVGTFDELVELDLDAIAIFTQRWTHAQLAIRALRAGKHVYSAVPATVTLEELDELVKTVEETGLTYCLGETSYYRPQAIWCRRAFAEGRFGQFVYGEGQYYHDMSHWFYGPYIYANGPDWKRYASVPPMWYPTHSVAHVLSVTFSRFTKVSCFGFLDGRHPDGIFDEKMSAFDNPWSNQSALFRTADGGMARINEFRRTGAGESRMSIIGTEGAYEEQPNPASGGVSLEQQMDGAGRERRAAESEAVFARTFFEEPPVDEHGAFDHQKAERVARKERTDLTSIHDLSGVEITRENRGSLPEFFLGKRHEGVSLMHEVERLPAEFVGLHNGHCGSHQFLVQDFMEAIETGKLPPNHVWLAARYNAPGIVAHESCKRDGECLAVPDYGLAPKDKPCLDPLVKLRD